MEPYRFMDTNVNNIQYRVQDIDEEIGRICRSYGYTYAEVIKQQTNLPSETLRFIYNLLVEKLQLQKKLFELQGQDLSNVIFIAERK